MMLKIGKVALGLLLMALVVELIIIAPQNLDESEESNTVGQIEGEEDRGRLEQSLSGVHLIEAREQSKEWELWSEHAVTYKESDKWELDGVKTHFFGKDGVVYYVTGKTGTVHIKTKNMTVRGNVKTRTSNGYQFVTDEISYVSQERTLKSPSQVSMTGPKDANEQNMFLTGEILEVNLDSSLMEIKRNVVAEKAFEDSKKVKIQSHRAQFSSASKYARFLDQVIIDFETMRLTGPDAVFNYDTDKQLVTSLMVQGGVKVSDLDKWATSERVNVEFEKEKYVFRGNPRVVQNNDELKGEEIIFYNGGKRVQVKKARANMEEQKSGAIH